MTMAYAKLHYGGAEPISLDPDKADEFEADVKSAMPGPMLVPVQFIGGRSGKVLVSASIPLLVERSQPAAVTR